MDIGEIKIWTGEWITLYDVSVDDLICISNEYLGKWRLGIK